MADLAELGFRGLRRATLGYFSSLVREGYPIYHLDYLRDRARLLDFVAETDNLVSCGRQGAFRYVFMDTAMEMGIAAAHVVLRRSSVSSGRTVAELRSERGLIEASALTA
jgi:hypothetical protein